jgi:hypothetical protein
MTCARSNARSAIPASVFRSLSKRDFYAGLEQTGTLEISALSALSVPLWIGRWLTRTFAVGKRAIAHIESLRLSYLFTPVVGVSAGVCVAPDFGMTVSFMVVDGMFGL